MSERARHEAAEYESPHATETSAPVVAGAQTRYVHGAVPDVGSSQTAEAKSTASELAYGPAPQADQEQTHPPDDPSQYGVPYARAAEALAAEGYLQTTLIPYLLARFGPETASLYQAYLARRPGDSLDPRVFSGETRLVESYRRSAETEMAQNQLVTQAEYSLYSEWDQIMGRCPIGGAVNIPVPRQQLQTDFSDANSIPGVTAGGISGSDAGRDHRSVFGHIRATKVSEHCAILRPDVEFAVEDCIDFLPGNPGTISEQRATVPMSRLEASGRAHDKPFAVYFEGPRAERRVDVQGPSTPARSSYAAASMRDNVTRTTPLVEDGPSRARARED